MENMIIDKKRLGIYNLLGGKCFYCGCTLDIDNFHADHFMPKSAGGKCAGNLVPACPDCNAFKTNLSIEEFRDKIANLRRTSYHASMMCKYYEIPESPVVFYFEEAGYGTI